MSTEDRLAILEHRMGAMESAFKEHLEASTEAQNALLRELQANTRLTEKVVTETAEVRAIWTQGTSAFHFFNFLMKGLKKVAVAIFILLIVFVGIPYMLANNGELPTWLKTLKQVLV